MLQTSQTQESLTTTILAVDDEPVILELTGAILGPAGYQVLLAGSGRDAVRIYESAPNPVDLLLTDVVMPDLNGPTLAARLREKEPGLNVLFISGFHDAQLVQRAIGDGFTLLAKPFTAESLLRAVRESLASNRI